MWWDAFSADVSRISDITKLTKQFFCCCCNNLSLYPVPGNQNIESISLTFLLLLVAGTESVFFEKYTFLEMSSFWCHFFLSPSEQTEGPTEFWGSGMMDQRLWDLPSVMTSWVLKLLHVRRPRSPKNLPRPLFLPPFCPSSMTHLVGRWRCRSPPPSWPGPWRVPAGWGRSSPPRPARSGTSDSGLCRLKEGEEKKKNHHNYILPARVLVIRFSMSVYVQLTECGCRLRHPFMHVVN